jgi:hypothetical protein
LPRSARNRPRPGPMASSFSLGSAFAASLGGYRGRPIGWPRAVSGLIVGLILVALVHLTFLRRSLAAERAGGRARPRRPRRRGRARGPGAPRGVPPDRRDGPAARPRAADRPPGPAPHLRRRRAGRPEHRAAAGRRGRLGSPSRRPAHRRRADGGGHPVRAGRGRLHLDGRAGGDVGSDPRPRHRLPSGPGAASRYRGARSSGTVVP